MTFACKIHRTFWMFLETECSVKYMDIKSQKRSWILLYDYIGESFWSNFHLGNFAYQILLRLTCSKFNQIFLNIILVRLNAGKYSTKYSRKPKQSIEFIKILFVLVTFLNNFYIGRTTVLLRFFSPSALSGENISCSRRNIWFYHSTENNYISHSPKHVTFTSNNFTWSSLTNMGLDAGA